MSIAVSHPSFPIPLFTQLVCRLRLTNARYKLIAYQCRRTQRPTYHAKRRAYRVGLRIDTSKALATWPDDLILISVSATSTQSTPVLDRTAGSPARVAETVTEEDPDWSVEDVYLPNPWPEPEVVVQEQPALSPLELGLNNVDDVDTRSLTFRGPVPGAPRWRSKPLPEEGDRGMAWKTIESVSPEALCTYEPVWRSVMPAHVSRPVSVPFGMVYNGLGTMVPPGCRKRKLQDVDVDESAVISRRFQVSVPSNGFSGAWWSGTRGWADL